MLNLNKT